MPNENLFYFVRFSIFHQKSTFNFSWNYVRFRRFFEFFQFNFPRNYVRFRRFLQKNFFTFDFDFRKKKFFYLLQLLRFLPVSSIPVVCIINTCITYDLTRLRCMNHLSASCVDSHMSSVTYNITRLWV